MKTILKVPPGIYKRQTTSCYHLFHTHRASSSLVQLLGAVSLGWLASCHGTDISYLTPLPSLMLSLSSSEGKLLIIATEYGYIFVFFPNTHIHVCNNFTHPFRLLLVAVRIISVPIKAIMNTPARTQRT